MLTTSGVKVCAGGGQKRSGGNSVVFSFTPQMVMFSSEVPDARGQLLSHTTAHTLPRDTVLPGPCCQQSSCVGLMSFWLSIRLLPKKNAEKALKECCEVAWLLRRLPRQAGAQGPSRFLCSD